MFCLACNKHKMLFETKSKADNFLKYNSERILDENGKAPVRSYYCCICRCWHVTSNPSVVDGESFDRKDDNSLNRINFVTKSSDKMKSISKRIIDRIKEMKPILNIGDFDKAEYLLDLCNLDLDDMRSYNCHKELLIKPICKIKEISDELQQLKRLYFMNETDQINVLHNMVCSYERKRTIRNFITIQKIDKILPSIGEITDDYILAEQYIKCVELINSLSGAGTNALKEKYTNALNSINREVKPIIKAPTENVVENVKYIDETAYKSSILSVIKKIESVADAYQVHDIETGKDIINLCYIILDDLDVNDDNTALLRRQLESWSEKLKEL